MSGSDFYPRPPRGGRHPYFHSEAPSFEFLSTPSARRATYSISWNDARGEFLSTPSARRATCKMDFEQRNGKISIHALREEGDRLRVMSKRGTWLFLSTPSARRATFELLIVICYNNIISIHALREEGDRGSPVQISCLWHFYPRPPRGGRPALPIKHQCWQIRFLSTPSARRATSIS